MTIEAKDMRWMVGAGLLALAACKGEDASATESGFASEEGEGSSGPGEWVTSGEDGGEPADPEDGAESCDAGDEAWAKRAIFAILGRRPESIREARLVASMVAQLDATGANGREIVALGLASGDRYLDRWKQFIYEQLKINVHGDRRNELCYDRFTDAANSPALAEFIRDNPATSEYSESAYFGDVVYSSLLLDDVSPAYRAQLYAQQSTPMIAGNTSHADLELTNASNFGKVFEGAYLGRFTECMDCHRTEMSVTDNADPVFDRHWPLPGNVEIATYGPDAATPDALRAHAIFRRFGFSTTAWLSPADDIPAGGEAIVFEDPPPEGNDLAWGMDAACGEFRFDVDEQWNLLTAPGYMITQYGMGATVMDLDENLRNGFAAFRTDGMALDGEGNFLDPAAGFAWLFSANFANKVWRELMGYPLTLANNFPRNEAQRDINLALATAFADNGYSLRYLLAALVTQPYFNQDTPDACGTSTPYHMAAVFDPFTKDNADPTARGNGVGDLVHRPAAMVLLDSLALSMWWDLPQRFGPSETEDEQPTVNCGAGIGACDEGPGTIDLQRDVGVFLSDTQVGHSGVDFTGLLRWEDDTARGTRINFGGDCTGPTSGSCADADFITQLIDVALASPGATMRDVMAAVKDRLITESVIEGGGETTVIEELTGVTLSDDVASVGRDAAETAARRFAGVLLNSPQFMLAGAPSADQDPANDPVLVVPGTSTAELCEVLGAQVLGGAYTWSCTAEGISISG